MFSNYFSGVFIIVGVAAFLVGSLSAELFPHDTAQVYTFENEIKLTDLRHKDSKISGYKIDGTLTVASLWKKSTTQLLSVELDTSKLSVLAKGPVDKPISTISNEKFYFLLENGKVGPLLVDSDTDTTSVNLKRGIASLFQLRLENGPFIENDSAGSCSGFYAAWSSTKYQKTKTDCSQWDMKVHCRSELPLGVSMKSLQVTDYDLSQDGILLNVNSVETHLSGVQAKTDVGSQIESRLTLKYTSGRDAEQLQFDDLEKAIASLEGFKVIALDAEVDGRVSSVQGNLKNLLKLYKNEFKDENIGKEILALVLAKVLPIARSTKSIEFVDILTSSTYKESMNVLIDLLGATQTEEAHTAFFQVYHFDKDAHLDDTERYLQSLSVGTRPVKAIIEDLYNKISRKAVKNDKLKDTLTQALAALSWRYASLSDKAYNDEIVVKIQNFILAELEEKCSSSDCKEVHIRALHNLKNPATIPNLVKIGLDGDVTCSVAALTALNTFPVIYFTEDNRKDLEKVFYQISRKYDSSARTLALDIILKMKPTKVELLGLLSYLNSNDQQFEVKTYLLQKLRMISEKCPRFAALLLGALNELPTINNYHVIAQKGLTTALQRPLSKLPAYNETLLSVQEIFNGVLKRGSVDLLLTADKEELSTFKLGIYTNGLSSFVGDSDSSDDTDDSPATAGMEISVQDVQFRPLVFFKGQSELMGHVWSGTASDPTPAYQATTLMQDHEHFITLQNGGTVYVKVFGARSIDLFGQVEFSLWNRNAHTEISQNSGSAVLGSMTYGTSFAKLENQFTLTSEPKIKLIADIDFYSTIMLCIQLGRPEMEFRYLSESSLQLSGDVKYSKKYSKASSYKLPGSTLALNQKNNEMCNKIFSS